MTETVQCCPECESADLRVRNPHKGQGKHRASDKRFLCYNCRHNFDEADRRETRSSSGTHPLSGLPRKLLEMDADTESV